jgi:hypothetical protein
LVSLSGQAVPGDLAARITCLATGEALTIAEFDAAELIRWQVRIDRQGTPRVRRESTSWARLRRDGALSELTLDRFLAPGDGGCLLIAGRKAEVDSPDLAEAWRVARRCYDGVSVLAPSAASVEEQLGEATARVPLSQWYELYLLEPGRSGRLGASPQRLFERGATRGATRTLRVRCEPSEAAGTAFAVVAYDGHDYTGLVAMASGLVAPGRYTVTATLRRPGKVSFDGLGVPLRKDTRSWAEVRAAVPERLSELRPARPAHLVLAVEVSGPEQQVAAHLDRAAQLVSNIAGDAECPVSFSLLAYGAHPHNLRVSDDPVAVLAWADRHELVLAQLSALREQAGSRPDHYPRAAKIECMLGQVASLLRDGHGRAAPRSPGGRLVLVTVGSRRPFPAWLDPVTEILPCPSHLDWRDVLRSLREDHQDVAFGAICGGDRDCEEWQLLGADASAELIVLDARRFAEELQLLRPPGERVPFPLVDH